MELRVWEKTAKKRQSEWKRRVREIKKNLVLRSNHTSSTIEQIWRVPSEWTTYTLVLRHDVLHCAADVSSLISQST